MRIKNLIKVGFILYFIITTKTYAQNQNNLIDALKNGTVSFEALYRYEFVKESTVEKNANASTLNTELGYKTGNFKNLSAEIVFQNTLEAGERRYNDTVNM